MSNKQTDVEALAKIRFAINGNPIPFDASMIPKLFVAYVAAERAKYYAAHDAAKSVDAFDENAKAKERQTFEQVFHEEVRHAIRDRSEIVDWMGNNMDVHLEPCDEIGTLVEWL